VAGHGQPAPGKGGAPGDLYLELEVRPDAHLQRDGADVLLDVPVTFSEAALGTKVQVPTIEGPVTVTIPPGTSSGARLRLRGKGIKKPDGSRGDQMVRVEIVAPKGAADDPETRKLLEALAKRTEQKSPRPF
jgi:molecular chaperone DnaJ